MNSREYSLKELAEESGVDPRTIRFYIQQKLLRGPESRGRHARYSEYHLKRLQTIRAMRDVYGLSLMEIRKQLLKAGDEEIQIVAFQQDRHGEFHEVESPSLPRREAGPSQRRTGMSSYQSRAKSAMLRSHDIPDLSDAVRESDLSAFSRGRFSLKKQPPPPLETLLGSLKAIVPGKARPSGTRGENWRHIEITPEIRLQVKEIFDEEEMARFEKVAEYLRHILLGADKK